ncbi:MAG: hypothetical protein KY475_11035, partial [Planctomycetes bacterium]|nr:hypothetical protein [Planctomycetota bacterium]
ASPRRQTRIRMIPEPTVSKLWTPCRNAEIGIPTIVDAGGRAERLERLSLGERTVSEDWLQKQLFECPELLPIDEIEPDYGPLIPIGREISTDAGPLDNLYISPRGLLTLVEAKLWKNPQARREVVGQIIDYAKEVSRWSYEDLDAKAKKATQKSLWELISSCAERLEEARFVDAVSRNMRAGRFLLLIVGDGIREEMERLAEFLQSTPQLRFTLALVELQLYRLGSDGRLLVIPVVVGRTTEVVRAVVRVTSTEGAHVDVSLDVRDDPDNATLRRPALTYDEFFAELANSGASSPAIDVARKLYDDFSRDPRFKIEWKAASLTIKLRDPVETSRVYSVLIVEKAGRAYVGWLGDQLKRVGVNDEFAKKFARDLGDLVGRRADPRYGAAWDQPAPLEALAAKYGDVKAIIDDLATAIYSQRLGEMP